MKVGEVLDLIGGNVETSAEEDALEREVSGCYVSDLLSDVMASSEAGNLWITQHTHSNIVAVAAIKDLCAVVVVGSKPIEEDTLKRAVTEKVTLISSSLSSFEVSGKVYTKLSSE